MTDNANNADKLQEMLEQMPPEEAANASMMFLATDAIKTVKPNITSDTPGRELAEIEKQVMIELVKLILKDSPQNIVVVIKARNQLLHTVRCLMGGMRLFQAQKPDILQTTAK